MNALARVAIAITLTLPLLAASADTTPSANASARHGSTVSAIAAPRDTSRTSMDGVYTAAQATKGKDVFAAYCRSCHTPTVHSGAPFRARWYGHTLGELFGYLRREMPKNDPGSMSDEDYALALAYLLRINEMPAGTEPLAADSAALHRIRLDSVRAAPSPRAPHR